jgi:hypothetical protein
MRLLKRHPGGADGDATTDTDTGGSEPPAEAAEPPAEEPATQPATKPTPTATDTTAETPRRRWGRRTVTVPVTVPQRSVRRTMTMPTRAVDRTVTSRGMALAPILATVAGGVLAVVGLVTLIRTGVDASWFRPEVEVLDADHTALLGLLEIGGGVLLVLAGLLRQRVVVAVLGLALALAATAAAIEPAELQRELAIERWWAWTLAAGGVVLVLSALQAPRERTRTVVDVT